MFKTTFPEHLYIHWPFCTQKCAYCDFISFQGHAAFQQQYHAALCNEITAWTKSIPSDHAKPIKTIFIGGGTPSLYPLPLITQLFTTLRTNFDCSTLEEVTIECNPSDITEEKLDTWHEIGINRISMGVQVLDDNVLAVLNRKQRISDVQRALTLIPKYFSNISVDLILGIPGVTQETWFATIETLLRHPITHLSVYFLTVYEKTPLYFSVKKNELPLLPDELMVETYLETVQQLTSHNFIQYELSNFCRPNFASIHNKAYWDRKPYRGFGLNASSFDGVSRTINQANLVDYITTMAESTNGECYNSIETLSPEQIKLETLMLGLRQITGIDLHSVLYLTNEAEREKISANITQLEKAGLITLNNNNIRLTPRGMVLENEVILKLV